MVVVRVHAAGLNRGELLALPGFRSDNRALKPMPAGIEFAGEIAEVGPDATGWHVGERVFGRGPGAYAEFVAAGAAALYRIPGDLSMTDAAAIPNVFVTAHDALATAGRVRAGERVLVTAGSSGIGTAAIQLARFLGASSVMATTRTPTKVAHLEALGADAVLDSSTSGWVDELMSMTDDEGVDVIVDSVGGPMLADNMRALALRGRLVSVGRNGGNTGECDMDQLALKRAELIGVTFRTRTPQESFQAAERFFQSCLDGFADRRLRPVVDRTFPFDDLAGAHQHMLGNGQIGKIVLTLP
jgi:NADPH:quinone reductase